MARRPILKKEQTRSKCVPVTRWGKQTRLCVRGAKYGFIAHLESKRPEAGILPVPTGKARTLETALKNARAFLKRFDAKQRKK